MCALLQVIVDLTISSGDTLCPHLDDPQDPDSSLLLGLLRKTISAPRPATASPGKRPGTAAARRLQQEWAASPAGMADLALR